MIVINYHTAQTATAAAPSSTAAATKMFNR